MRFALSIEYIGEKYYGWQKQNSDSTNTVQYFVDKAISKVANHEVKTICSGRTDTGVNALNQIIHFDSDSSRSEKYISIDSKSAIDLADPGNAPKVIISVSIFHSKNSKFIFNL